ncbi:MAG TPA: FAD-dependent oxidoreductase [Verrucomicrobiota bacterium]|nr:FAD-dependent oxidoreductase [Verrucomicrobiota bacterium]
MNNLRLVIIGGVAGGASAATRARRLSESAEITVFERGNFVSFANCGIPYYIGEEIKDQKELVLQTPQSFHARYNIDVRLRSEVIAIDSKNKLIKVRNLDEKSEYDFPYDALVISTGAAPVKPPVPGINREGIFTVRDIPDAERIKDWITKKAVQSVVIIGAGFIGLEMAEQLRGLNLNVTVVEALPQVMTPLDPEMAALVQSELKSNSVQLRLSNPVAGFEEPKSGESAKSSIVVLKNGERLPADMVLICTGVKPEVALAKSAGIEIGNLGGIRVNEYMQTSNSSIWAVGDAVEVKNEITGAWSLIPLAGLANRQGRVAADNIFGKKSVYTGGIGTIIVRLFKLTAAATGVNEKTAKQSQIPYQVVHIHPRSHASYYPGGGMISLKLLFNPETRKVLGAQAVGIDGVDKRIDIIATAIKAKMTVDELVNLELCYSPPFGSAKDPVNLAGMAAQNILDGLTSVAQYYEVDSMMKSGVVVLDVRTPAERAKGSIPGSIHIALDELRNRINELPKDMEILVHCQSGQRSYFACRILKQNGFKVKNLSGSYLTWGSWFKEFGIK